MSDWADEIAENLFLFRGYQVSKDAIAAALRKARSDALEEVIENRPKFTGPQNSDIELGWLRCSTEYISAIRALKDKP